MSRIARSARLAAVALLLVWVGPVTLVQTDSWTLLRWAGAPGRALATTFEQRMVAAGQALTLGSGTPLVLHLKDGTDVHGRFLGRALLDSAVYAPRFAAFVRASGDPRFALGETLNVRLRDGREWASPFAGYAEQTLLLATPDSAGRVRVPFEYARAIRRASGEEIDPATLASAFRAGLPSAEAIVVGEEISAGTPNEDWAAALRIPVEDIATATVTVPVTADNGASGGSSAGDHSGEVVGVIVVSVLIATVIMLLIVGSAMNSLFSPSGCSQGAPMKMVSASALVQLTTRTYDRDRSCFVGDRVAAPDGWPANAFALQALPALPGSTP
jgi:hypothetical protein